MDQIQEAYAKSGVLHHAYLVLGESAHAREAVFSFLRSVLNVSPVGNPDVTSLHFASLGVDDARYLGELASRKAFGAQKFFVVSFSFVTTEAQNALLKLLEEPTAGTHFFLLTHGKGTLLPTVLSRLNDITLSHASSEALGKAFLSATKAERVKLIKPIIDAKDKEAVEVLTAQLLSELQAQLTKSVRREQVVALDAVLRARKYLGSKAASLKMILEYLVAVVPS